MVEDICSGGMCVREMAYPLRMSKGLLCSQGSLPPSPESVVIESVFQL